MMRILDDDTIGLSFDDVSLVPQFSDIETRKDVSLLQPFMIGKSAVRFGLPVIASPMDTVSEDKMAVAMLNAGGLSILHRYCTIERQVDMVREALDLNSDRVVGAAVGVKNDYFERAGELLKAGAKVICIDVAHGRNSLVKKAMAHLQKCRDRFEFHLMVGNAADGAGFVDLADWGADSVRLAVGSGSICSTAIQTGHGVPGFGAILDCVKRWNYKYDVWNESTKRPLLIMDGGIRKGGDIVKAIAAGADFVMCGSLLSGTDEAPGEVLDIDGKKGKRYAGMASRSSQTNWRGHSSAPEGISTIVPYKGKVRPILDDLKGNIQSGFSYSGARNIAQLRENAVFIRRSAAAQSEAFTHILNHSIGAG